MTKDRTVHTYWSHALVEYNQGTEQHDVRLICPGCAAMFDRELEDDALDARDRSIAIVTRLVCGSEKCSDCQYPYSLGIDGSSA